MIKAITKNLDAFAIKIVATAVLFYLHTLIGQRFGLSGYGVFSIAMVVAVLMSEICTMGWSRSITRFIVDSKHHKADGEYRYILRLSHSQTLAVALSWVIISYVVYRSFLPNEQWLLFSSVLVVFLSLNAVRRKVFIVERKFTIALLPVEVIVPLSLVVCLFLFEIKSIAELFFYYIGVHSLVFCVVSVLFFNLYRAQRQYPLKRLPSKNYSRISAIVLIGVIGQLLINRVDMLMVGALMSDSDLGLYSSATRIARLNPFFLGIVAMIFSPLLAKAHQEMNFDRYRRLLLNSMFASAMISLPILLVCLIFPQYILSLFGDDFIGASEILIVLSIGQYINAATGPIANALVVSNMEKEYAKTLLGFAVISSILNYILIQKFGLIGAAYATAISVIFLNLYQLKIVLSVLKSNEED